MADPVLTKHTIKKQHSHSILTCFLGCEKFVNISSTNCGSTSSRQSAEQWCANLCPISSAAGSIIFQSNRSGQLELLRSTVIEITMQTPTHSILSLSLIFAGALQAQEAEPTTEQIQFFESKIRPVLIDACYECHSSEGGRVKGGLALDSREGLRLGGDSGVAIEPGNADDSLLWISLTHTDPDYEMPPKKKMPDEVVADFKKWIDMGAPDPRSNETFVVKSEIDIEEGKKFWSFQKPARTKLPEVENEEWVKSDIDKFVLAKLKEAELKPAKQAEPTALVRRLFFDLIGLPPSPDQARKFFEAWKENPDDAVAGIVEQLLDSNQFGERWGRHWLDAARYAESTGKDVNVTFPHAWRYRDYVIDSFNEDKPYDRFLKEQVAGDLLPIKNDEDWQENLVATGFLALGTKGLNEQSARQFQMDLVDEQIDTLTQATLGLTVACARCHDHKFDPIPTADYYALAGIFLSTETYFGTVPAVQNRRSTDLLILPVDDPTGPRMTDAEREGLEARLAGMLEEQAELRQQRRLERSGQGTADPNAAQKAIRLTTVTNMIQAKLKGIDENGQPKTFAMGVQDRDSQIDATVLVRGEIDKPAQPVERGFVQVVDHSDSPTIKEGHSGRLELADWLTSTENPLTARVMVNRVWMHLFGKGIVASPNNFGTTGQAPTHPELLDHLAMEFMASGWSVKSLIRDIVLSQTYQMSSEFDSSNYQIDPDNNLIWRANQRRLDAEAIRDSMLAVGGNLDLARPRGSLVSETGDARIGQILQPETFDKPSVKRSVYLPIVRDAVPESLALFDFAEPGLVAGNRESTNVPSQALYLMNNTFVSNQAKSMGATLLERFDNPKQRVGYAFLQTYGRPPTDEEIKSCIDFFQKFMPAAARESGSRQAAEQLAMSTFCQALFSSAEFRYLN